VVREIIHLAVFLPVILMVATILSVQFPLSVVAEKRQNFQVWLRELRTDALSKGISKATLDLGLDDLKPNPRIIKLDRSQPEFTLTLEAYLNRIVREGLIDEGRDQLAQNRVLLEKISRRYGVQARFLVALWGIETKFGRLTGNYPVMEALATLAYDGRRAALFRNELLQALRILDEGHISLDEMTGSWAGAMGQLQFMPSSFRKFATDFDGDGRIDIWHNLADAFASAGNYLSRSGWVRDQTWGHAVSLPNVFDRSLTGLKTRKRLGEWRALGVSVRKGQVFPDMPNLLASVVEPDGRKGRAFIVYDNYRIILKWNRSNLFGVAVGLLADRLVDY
jgi:membrane-bound lytic murein transglycosylase B